MFLFFLAFLHVLNDSKFSQGQSSSMLCVQMSHVNVILSDGSYICIFQEMIQLEGIPNLSGLVQSFDQQQLANFCRILSVTISEPDVGNDDKHTLLAKNAQQKRNASPSRAEVNQGTLTT